MPYIADDTKEILSDIGLTSTDELFKHIPQNVRLDKELKFPADSESQIIREAKQNAADNFTGRSFLGYGLYTHEIPVAVDHISANRNFVTSYTPYQPEVAQGTLQAIFEYQSLMSSLTSMDIVNASMYDAATALVEAIRMDLRQNKSESRKILLSESIHPYILKVVETYFPDKVKQELDIEFELLPLDKKTGSTPLDEEKIKSARSIAFLNPTMWGTLEKNIEGIKKINPKITVIYGTLEILSLSVLKSPLEVGADIVWGDAQSLGIPVSYGGPTLGFLAARENFLRQMPGRLIGKTEAKNKEGEKVDSYVITLSTREQHIRREKATSNICSNQSLMAIRASAYMAHLGWSGMQNVCLKSMENARYFLDKLKSKGIAPAFAGAEYFHEVSWITDSAKAKYDKAFENEIAMGAIDKFDGKDVIISYFSDIYSSEDVDKLVDML